MSIQLTVAKYQQLKVVNNMSTLHLMMSGNQNPKIEFSKRLCLALEHAGVSAERGQISVVAKMFGVSGESARKWLSGESIPATKRIAEMAYRLGVNGEWLLANHGPMLPTEVNQTEGEPEISPYILSLARLISKAPIKKVEAIAVLLDADEEEVLMPTYSKEAPETRPISSTKESLEDAFPSTITYRKIKKPINQKKQEENKKGGSHHG